MVPTKKMTYILKAFKKGIIWFVGLVIGIIAVKQISKIGEPKKSDNWKPLPGHKDKVVVENTGKKTIVKLPKDPETGEQIKNTDIVAVGIQSEGGGVKNVTIIKKRPIDGVVFDDSDNRDDLE